MDEFVGTPCQRLVLFGAVYQERPPNEDNCQKRIASAGHVVPARFATRPLAPLVLVMDTPSAPPLAVPRLRLTRRGSSPQSNDMDTPIAGPSRRSTFDQQFGNEMHDGEDDSDIQSTPKISLVPELLPSSGALRSSSPADTPGARLRAVLSRVPNPSAGKPATPPPVPSSEMESDFDMPQFSAGTPSILARESLKDLFSKALRDPGNTPQKRRARRSSIDFSEVEASPRAERERESYRGKRKSLSDEEMDKPSSMLFAPSLLRYANGSL